MAIGCGAKCAKFILIAFNILFWLSGVALLAVGIWLRVDERAADIIGVLEFSTDGSSFYAACYVIIAVGGFVFLVGFCGCCGAIMESQCLLVIYIICLVIVFIVELAAGISAAVYKDKIKDELETGLYDTINKTTYYGNNGNYTPTAWGVLMNLIQNELECCGIDSKKDYMTTLFKNSTTNPDSIPFPYTCCKLSDGADPENAKQNDVENWTKCQEDEFYDQGCYKALIAWLDDNITILIGVGIGIALLQVFGFIFAICLCRNVGDD